jgi:hypothetical protein
MPANVRTRTSLLLQRFVGHWRTDMDNDRRYRLPFHGGNTGSNPVGDARYFKVLRADSDRPALKYGKCTEKVLLDGGKWDPGQQEDFH